MTTSTFTEAGARASGVGKRRELARYAVGCEERIVYGQRVDGVVRFLPWRPVVLVASSCRSEDGRCRPREGLLDTANHVRALDGANGNAREG